MEQLMKTAKTMDKVLNIISKIFIIAASIAVIAVGILAIGYAIGLDPDMTTNSVSIDCIDFELAQPVAMDTKDALTAMGVITVFVVVAATYIWYLIRVLRRILKPMTEGTPFVGTVSTDIRKLGNVVIIGGFVTQCVTNLFLFFNYNLLDLVINDAVSHVSINYELIDTTCLLIGILVIMLSYVFRYGEELQQQADETL